MTSLMFIAFGLCRRISRGRRLGETTQENRKDHYRSRRHVHHHQLHLRHYSHHHHHHHHHHQLLIITVKMVMTITNTISISHQVDPLYDSRRGHRNDYDGTFPEYSSHVLPHVARNQQRKQDAAG